MDGGASLGLGSQLFLLTLLASSVSPVRCVTLANSQGSSCGLARGGVIDPITLSPLPSSTPPCHLPPSTPPSTSLRLPLPPPPSVYLSLPPLPPAQALLNLQKEVGRTFSGWKVGGNCSAIQRLTCDVQGMVTAM
ncbi:unnamed protein product [Closterium sp. NIES-65]|nr:unnamed protein product [Closterium sp. NIES-65]